MVLVPNHTGCEGRTRITLKASHSYEVLGFGRNESGNAVFDITDGKNVFTVDTDYLPLPPY